MANWFWLLENWAYQSLIRSPTFHRGVRAIEKKVREVRYGKDVEDMGGTKIDREGEKSVFQHFVDELKDQAKGGNRDKH